MENVKEKKLEVRDLTISFRTVSGKLQAVRGINFDLYKGETLAIVGESGSGKSVTSKAILGILAGNSIIEGGEIIYDGKDLLKIKEDDFYRIRGDKISMIFQDPLSSLNPIMRIGKQLTEAMILKGKLRQKESRNNFNTLLARLEQYMTLAYGEARKAEFEQKCKNFDKFEFKHIELEKAYNIAHENAVEAISDIENYLFLIDKNAFDQRNAAGMKDLLQAVSATVNKYVVDARAQELAAEVEKLKKNYKAEVKAQKFDITRPAFVKILDILKEAVSFDVPNFFSMGYYITFVNEPLPELPTLELNAHLRKVLDERFMLEFIENTEAALKYSANEHYALKQKAVDLIAKNYSVFEADALDQKQVEAAIKEIIEAVNASIDTLEINKDSIAYTFASSIKAAVEIYFSAVVKNQNEKVRFEKQNAKYQKLVKSGKNVSWKVVPASYADLELLKRDIRTLLDRISNHYKKQLADSDKRAYHDEAVGVIDYLKLNASGVVHKVTKSMARHKAIKLMEEVGISEPRLRYKQYPFEFSGGMRQRMVIAIALAADPDILICDEPTTALDVTIQAQILELINKIKKERNLSIIFITHDLGVVANMADKIAVMYAGKIVEYGTSEDIFYSPAHPYTWALLSSMPDLDTNDKLESIPGTPPNMIYPPVGDAFAERNKYALAIDFEQQPPMFEISDTHSAATWLLHPNAPKLEMPEIVKNRIKRMNEQFEKSQNAVNGGENNA